MNARGTLTFLAKDSSTPVYRPSVGGAKARLDLSGNYSKREIEILDGRDLLETFSVHEQGFQLVKHKSVVTDIYDTGQRAQLHDVECCELVTTATEAAYTHVFDHTLRSSDSSRRKEKRSREPTTVVHNDYTPRSGPQRVRDLMGNKAKTLLQNHFAIINVWRPVRPVDSFPLAMCDARTVQPELLIRAERRAKNRIGEIYVALFDSKQRWIYFPGMETDEALLIKTYDSREDGRARWCIHTAFDADITNPNARPRESIETRVFAFISPNQT
ncbi:MAG: CmcJ/NvfI family oxidoreductase [Pseudomonadota bacterium]|jgi:hypothetical protein|nr:CmcJ/NvfI family oxidoreductase [Pseudomonadota bacterium]